MIIKLRDFPNKVNFLPNENGREINIYSLDNCIFGSCFYPDIKIYSDLCSQNRQFYDPVDEKIMSLANVELNSNKIELDSPGITLEYPVFFFIFNTDNYYHFLYDSVPYLISYLYLRKELPELKLLMNYPNSQSRNHYKFVLEFLELLGIKEENIEIISKKTLYKKIYFSDSFTHGVDSNLLPRKEIYSLYSDLIQKTHKIMVDKIPDFHDRQWGPEKIYISRRSHIHGDFSNIGTNYTTRRKCQNEDELVEYLKTKDYTEVFTEKLSTIDKIVLFNNATHIIGALGGGLANALFCKPECKLVAIESPGVLEVNYRYKYFLDRINTTIFRHTSHIETEQYKKFMRVKYENIIGEITDIKGGLLTIQYLPESLAGWNNNIKYKEIKIEAKKCERLDFGLNSAWKLDLNEFKKLEI